jgi:hypothetical protein
VRAKCNEKYEREREREREREKEKGEQSFVYVR